MKKFRIFHIAVIFSLSVIAGCRPDSKSPAAGASSPEVPVQEQISKPQGPLKICSFNVQFLGSFELRQNQVLADLMKDSGCVIVVVQELVAPPDLRVLKGSSHYQAPFLPYFPNTEERFRPKQTSTDFFLAMERAGFEDFILSDEDTGTAANIHNNGSQTEWWVTFYRADIVKVADDLPFGFLAEDRSAHPEIDRVPYAVPFRTLTGQSDFVLISVHLRPGDGRLQRARRQQELSFINQWIRQQEKTFTERDYIILGDMNIEDGPELTMVTPEGFVSLNTGARFMTNTNVSGPKPYDHVMVRPEWTREVPVQENFQVIDLIGVTKARWSNPTLFPGKPYIHNLFRMYFSDHHPVLFELHEQGRDDD